MLEDRQDMFAHPSHALDVELRLVTMERIARRTDGPCCREQAEAHRGFAFAQPHTKQTRSLRVSAARAHPHGRCKEALAGARRLKPT